MRQYSKAIFDDIAGTDAHVLRKEHMKTYKSQQFEAIKVTEVHEIMKYTKREKYAKLKTEKNTPAK